jgi:hypothetical protein
MKRLETKQPGFPDLFRSSFRGNAEDWVVATHWGGRPSFPQSCRRAMRITARGPDRRSSRPRADLVRKNARPRLTRLDASGCAGPSAAESKSPSAPSALAFHPTASPCAEIGNLAEISALGTKFQPQLTNQFSCPVMRRMCASIRSIAWLVPRVITVKTVQRERAVPKAPSS